METESISLAFAVFIGFGHAFEADHLLAVSTLVSKAQNTRQMIREGFVWGLGHTSTILVIGLLLLVFQVQELKAYFDYFEAFVGIMLILLGISRLWKAIKAEESVPHSHQGEAFGIGLVHGLAGSGALVLLVMTELDTTWEALTYLGVFGLGSAIGMSVASLVLQLPIIQGKMLGARKQWFSGIAGVLCIGYGLMILARYF